MADSLIKIKEEEKSAYKELKNLKERLEEGLRERRVFWERKKKTLQENHTNSLSSMEKEMEREWKSKKEALFKKHEEEVRKIKENYKKNLGSFSKKTIEELL